MAFKIENPNWKNALQKKADQHAPAVSAWLAANSASRFVGLAELRAGMPDISADLNRTVLNQICANLGLNVLGAEDQEG